MGKKLRKGKLWKRNKLVLLDDKFNQYILVEYLTNNGEQYRSISILIERWTDRQFGAFSRQASIKRHVWTQKCICVCGVVFMQIEVNRFLFPFHFPFTFVLHIQHEDTTKPNRAK